MTPSNSLLLEKIESLRTEVNLHNKHFSKESSQRHENINKMFAQVLKVVDKHDTSINNIKKVIWALSGAIAILGFLFGNSFIKI
jgi:hypothetical protein